MKIFVQMALLALFWMAVIIAGAFIAQALGW